MIQRAGHWRFLKTLSVSKPIQSDPAYDPLILLDTRLNKYTGADRLKGFRYLQTNMASRFFC